VQKFAVIDFETTGLSPQNGDRVIEVGVAITDGAKVLDTYQSLMNPGISIPSFITGLTGISQSMVSSAPRSQSAMREVSQFIGDLPVVAHNASFDQNFFVSELERLNQPTDTQFICTMLVGRRLYPLAPNHKLATLAKLHNISTTGHHRALADAVMTAELLHSMTADLEGLYSEESIDAPFMRKYQKTRKADTRSSNKTLSRYSWS
jgi:DNA polymerase-3 subunit epsilon